MPGSFPAGPNFEGKSPGNEVVYAHIFGYAVCDAHSKTHNSFCTYTVLALPVVPILLSLLARSLFALETTSGLPGVVSE